jgi:hypothetical protein
MSRKKRKAESPDAQVARARAEAEARGFVVDSCRWCEETRGVVVTVLGRGPTVLVEREATCEG